MVVKLSHGMFMSDELDGLVILALHCRRLTSPELNLILSYLELKPTPPPGPYWFGPYVETETKQEWWSYSGLLGNWWCKTGGDVEVEDEDLSDHSGADDA